MIVYIFGFFSLVTTATEINLEPNLAVESCIDKWTEKGLLNARTFYYCMSKHTEEFTEPLYHYKKYSNLELRIVPYVPKVSKLIWANVTAWEETRSKQGFGTTSVYALKSERNCKKDGEYYTINRKFVAQTHGSEEIYTRHVTYLKIGSQ